MKGEETENKKIGCTVNLMVRGHGPFLLSAQWNGFCPTLRWAWPFYSGSKPKGLSQDISSVTGILETCTLSVTFPLGKGTT